jgi:flagellar basal-body rod protein FlgG
MLRAFSTAATGMIAQQMIVDNIANNLANMNTTGFKRAQIDFQDLMYSKMQESGRPITSNANAPSGFEVGSGVRPASTLKVYTEGELTNTGRNLDVAIQGDGFLEVTVPNVGTMYTRDGSLQVNASGQLVTANGLQFEPAITIPTTAVSISIGTDGTVSTVDGAGATTTAGQLAMVRFANPSGLSSEGNNLLSQTQASGSPTVGKPGDLGFGTIQQGYLESSNVQMVTELVNLITAQRAYETNSRAISAGDSMLQTANRLAGG